MDSFIIHKYALGFPIFLSPFFFAVLPSLHICVLSQDFNLGPYTQSLLRPRWLLLCLYPASTVS